MFGEITLALSIAGKLIPAVKKTIKAAKKNSPGGKRITPREREAIIRSIFPVVEEIVDEIAESYED